MSDDDWDADDFEVPTFGEAPSFEDEEEEEEEVVEKPKPRQKPTIKKKVEKAPRNFEDPSDLFGIMEESERERLQNVGVAPLSLNEKKTEATSCPLYTMPLKNLKDYKKFGTAIVEKHILKHKNNKSYKEFLKTIIREATAEMTSQDVKEIEKGVIQVRQERVKEEKEAKSKSNKGPRKQVNVGGNFGDAGIDDAGYGSLDMDDFM